MRSSSLVGLVGSVGLIGTLLALAACSSESSANPGDDGGTTPDGGKKSSSSSSGSSGEEETDAGKKKDGGPTGEIESETLVQGDVTILGIAVDDAIYIEFGQNSATLNAMPLAGGQPTKIADLGEDDEVSLSGGAVGVWTTITDGLGTLGVWSRATGLKADVATGSVSGALFRASEDGTRIAFTQGGVVNGSGKITTASVGVRDTSAAANAVTLTGTAADGNAMNLASANCPVTMEFVGKVFFAEFCIGTSANTATAKLVTVAATGTTVDRLDAAGAAAATLEPKQSFTADSTGTKLFVVRKTNDAGRIFTVGGAVGGATVENDIAEGSMLSDGSAVIYRTTANVLKKATTASPPVITTLVAADAKGILGISPDAKTVLFNKLDADTNTGAVDVNALDHTASAPAPAALVATTAAFYFGVNGASSHAVFLGDISQTGAKLKSAALAGGAAKDLGDSVGALFVKTGTGVISASNAEPSDPNDPDSFLISDIAHVDSVTGTSATISDSVPEGEIYIKGKRIVYTRFAAQGSGLYAADLP